jgi:cyclophilin family peptidyl-prolyl cis-trans isomerase
MAIPTPAKSSLRQRPRLSTPTEKYDDSFSFAQVHTPRMLETQGASSSLDVRPGVSPCPSSTKAQVKFSFQNDRHKPNKKSKAALLLDNLKKKNAFAGVVGCFFLCMISIHLWHTRSYRRLASELKKMTQSKEIHEKHLHKARQAADGLAIFSEHTQDQLLKLKGTEKHMQDQLSLLRHRISKDSYAHVVETYGRGPHRVVFELDLPRPHNEFILELAPLDLMPHSNHVFLEAVRNKIWDGKAFWINSNHLIQAGSSYTVNEQGDGPNSEEKTSDANYELYSMSFREYAVEFDHAPWTAGFAGHPGGPDFYINKRNNLDSHGPNTQAHHTLPGDADPCFARVVSGFDTLRAVDSGKLKEGSVELEQPIKIVHARVV